MVVGMFDVLKTMRSGKGPPLSLKVSPRPRLRVLRREALSRDAKLRHPSHLSADGGARFAAPCIASHALADSRYHTAQSDDVRHRIPHIMRLHPPQLIESDELLLRPLTPKDTAALFDEMLSDAGTMRYLPFPRHTTLDETLAYIEESRRGWESGELIRWVLTDKVTGNLTGLIQLVPCPPRVEIGFIISREGGSRKRRAFFYALRKLIKWLMAQPVVYRLYACCATDGYSHSFMERLGFVLEAKLTNYECRPNIGMLAGDSYLYVITRPAHVLTAYHAHECNR